MKRASGLWNQIRDRDNLRRAALRALRGKRNRSEVRAYTANLEANLLRVQGQLDQGCFHFGRFHQYLVYDPKERVITAPCFEERIVHHAIMNICEPVFERWFIHDTFACRVGKGREGAIKRAQRFSHHSGAYLKMDIRKYFDSIDHRVLIAKLARIFKEPKLIMLFVQIIESFRGSIGYGLPIGSLTSQHFANFFLGHFDRFVEESLHRGFYLRYMDDMLIFDASTSDLVPTRDACTAFLRDELQLQCKGVPFINRTRHGVDFLGFRIFPSHIALNRRSRVRYRRRLMRLEKDYLLGRSSMPELSRRALALTAFATSSGVSSWQFRHRVLQQFSGGWSQGLEPGEPRWQLEQRAGELPAPGDRCESASRFPQCSIAKVDSLLAISALRH